MTEIDEYGDRLKVFGWLAVLVIVVLIARACYLQIYDGETYARLAEGNRIRIIPPYDYAIILPYFHETAQEPSHILSA